MDVAMPVPGIDLGGALRAIGLCLVVAAAYTLDAGVAHARAAEHIELTYTAPQGCPQRDDVLRAIERQLGAQFSSDTRLRANARVTERGPQDYELVIDYSGSSGSSSDRRVHSESCAAAADAAALLLALALIPTAAAPAPAPVPSSSRAAGSELGLLTLLDSAVLPGIGFGFGLQFGLSLGAWRINLSVAQWLSEQVELTGAQVHLDLWSVDLGACYLGSWGAFQAGPCARVEVGRLSGYALGVDAGRPDGARLQAASLGAQARIRLFSPVWLLVELGLEWIERRPQFVVAGIGAAHHPDPWGARLGFGPLLIW
jgi:hypothetical protein